MFCNVSKDRVISSPDVDSVYDIPLNFEKENLGKIICSTMGIEHNKKITKSKKQWIDFSKKIHNVKSKNSCCW